MTRIELRRLAMDRLRDARALLAARRWSGAYYLCGCAIECGLKACIISYLMKTDEFPEKRFSEQCRSHNLVQLLGLAGLKAAFDADAAANPELFTSWEEVKDWTESSRYDRKTKMEARQLYEAVTNSKHGVFPWIKARW